MLIFGVFILSLFLTTKTNATPINELKFNGANQYMLIANHSDFNISTTEDFTISMWIKATSYVASQRYLSKRNLNTTNPGSNRTGYEFFSGGSSTSSNFGVNTPTATTGNIISVYTPGAINAGSWFHVALVVNRTDGKIYIYKNGLQTNASSASISTWEVANSYDILIGAGLGDAGANNFMNGSVANVRFYKRALNTSEIGEDMNQNDFAQLSSALKNTAVGAYDFAAANITGLTVADLSGKNHNGILFNFPVDGPAIITNISLTQNTSFTGRGNDNEPILKARVTTAGNAPSTLNNLRFNMAGTTSLADVQSIKVYSTGSTNKFDSRDVSSATLIGTALPMSGDVDLTLTGELNPGTNYIWVTYQLTPEAKEGNTVDASLISLTSSTGTFNVTNASPTGARTILLEHKLLFAPGDLGSKNYRIPALIKAQDGSLVSFTDKRKNNQNDLPEDIDLLVKRSVDNGKTWSDALTVAKGAGTGQGFGDAALVRTTEQNGLLAIFAGGPGLNTSTPSNPIRTYISKSIDNGQSWSTPTDITSQLYGAECSDTERKSWYASFCASGNGLLTRDGRIMFVAAVRETSSSTLSNYVYYSSDNGATWSISGKAMTGGDEAKITELNDGTLLMSIRRQSKGARYYTKSTNGGSTWSTPIASWNDLIEPNCNGDMIRYTSVLDGYEKNRLLHSIPNDPSNRVNVSVFVSYDEGSTWPVKKSICPTGSAYSSLTVLSDGTIGAFVEENPDDANFSMYFTRFSLDWLTNGADSYNVPNTVQAVATPIFSVMPGQYVTAQNVEISSTTPGASIHYTVDGSTPTKDSPLYSSPIIVTATTQIKSIAVKDGMANSSIANATYIIKENCKPTGTITRTDRYVRSLSFTGSTSTFNSGTLEASGTRPLYTDKTVSLTDIMSNPANLSKVIQVVPGATLKPTVNWAGEWMHGYLYIDYNSNSDFSDAGELVSYTYYQGKNSLGQNTTNNSKLDNVPAFTLPANLADGTYRLRLKIDWDNIDPCPQPTTDIVNNGGSIIDFTVYVKAPLYYTVSYEQPTNGTLKVKKANSTVVNSGDNVQENTVLTVEATPSSGYTLKNIKVNGVVLTSNTFNITSNSIITAEFTNDRLITISSIGNGTVSIVNSATNVTINDGDWIPNDTEVKITAVPETNYKIVNATLAGVDILSQLEAGEYITKITQNSLLNITFSKVTYPITYTFDSSLGSVNVTNNGVAVSSGSQVEHGSVLSFTINPGSGNSISKILINGVDKTSELIIGANRSFTLTITQNTQVEILLEGEKYVLTLNNPQYGTMVVTNEADEQLISGATIVKSKVLNVLLTPSGSNQLLSLMVQDGSGDAALDYLAEGYVENNNGKYTTQVFIAGNVSIEATFSTSTAVENNQLSSIRTFINQSGDIVIEGATIGSEIMIYDLVGRLITKFKSIKDKEIISNSKLNKSAYIVKIMDGSTMITRKLVK